MLFSEPAFLFLFLPVVLGLYAVCPRPARNALLLAASIVFYASGSGAFTSLVVALVVGNYVAARWIAALGASRRATWAVAVTVGLNLAVLAIFKYAAFGVTSLNAVLGRLGVTPLAVPDIALPIGISFFVFHAISYVVDVKRGDATAQKGPVEAGLYLLLFPQLIAGPIIRYREIATQLTARRTALADVAAGTRRFIVGLAKKLLVADVVAGPADAIFALDPAELTAVLAWLGALCYTLQIYFDFSGYSDMAIGLGRLFGFRFPENFRYPYAATSVQDFWRRWHLSLSAWFRDYLYVPLGGGRVAPARVYLNLVTVFFLCGLWHGASWTFVAWGLYHGAFLVIERAGRGPARRSASRVVDVVRRAYTLLVVVVGWVIFRAETFAGAEAMLGAMVGRGEGRPATHAWAWYVTPELALAAVCGVVGAVPLVPTLSRRWLVRESAAGQVPALGWASSAIATTALALLLIASLALGAARTYSPFIYFRF